MTLRWMTVILLCASALTAAAQTPEQLYTEANSLYQQGKLTEARERYETIGRDGWVSGELYFNLGNCYYKLGDFGKAILNYERAARLLPNDDDIRFNLQLAGLRITDRIEHTPRLFLWDWWDSVKGSFSLRSATWTAYGAYALVVILAAALILARTYAMRKWMLIALLAGSCFFAASLTLFLAKESDDMRRDEAVVTAPVTTIKNSPDRASSDAFVLHAGVKVLILDSVNDWVKVRLPDGKVGWMEQSAAEII
jgi:tetratricopeptide (TPR) repeat protein